MPFSSSSSRIPVETIIFVTTVSSIAAAFTLPPLVYIIYRIYKTPELRPGYLALIRNGPRKQDEEIQGIASDAAQLAYEMAGDSLTGGENQLRTTSYDTDEKTRCELQGDNVAELMDDSASGGADRQGSPDDSPGAVPGTNYEALVWARMAR